MSKTIKAAAALELLKNGEAVLIDVREPDEFKAEHIGYALSVPLSKFKDDFKKLDLPKNKKILIHCLKGTRGAQACELAIGMDDLPNEVLNIEGGITGWKEDGFSVIGASNSGGFSIFRQVQMIVGGAIALLVVLGFAMSCNLAFIFAGIFGAALCFAGLTGFCGLAYLLGKMPWNK
jgi:rhodanese-related sulfurtransferase